MKRNTGMIRLTVAASLCAIACGGCNTPTGRQFRDAALPNIESGVHAILTGFVDGVFASIETEPESDEMMGGG
jgi:hypothetical protein